MAFAGSAHYQAYEDDAHPHVAARARLDVLARLMDNAFVIPGTGIGVGADALLNIVPGAGTLLATGVSAYLVWEARQLGAPRMLLAKMAGNVGLDAVISMVPLVGWVGDVFFRANVRNVKLLQDHLDKLARLKAEDGSITTSWQVVK
ncbi:DUF4112 domain-containing protein [Emcibacter sp. SYSU 3D8]|uniref:DUF4112 domain-containing protein n=1 Tax=Emcibacter sp. SYSU 3D8 TaxID=3133969 RepID=UPI0031FE6F81